MKTDLRFSSYLAQFFLEWEMFRTKLLETNFFFFENSAVYEIMWTYMVQPDRPQMIIWRMRITFWVPKATNTHSEYVIRIAFPLQQWLHKRAPVLSYTYIACIV
jgi:hypothetical protein